MKSAMVALIWCLAAVSGAAAGYTDSLWDQSEDRIYYDCGDWSGVDNSKNTHLRGYGWCTGDQGMCDPATFGLPNDLTFSWARSPGPSNMGWVYLYIHGFDKTLNHNGKKFTDDPTKINYIRGYLTVHGFEHYPAWNVRKVSSTVGNRITATKYIQTTSITIKYRRFDGWLGYFVYEEYTDTLSRAAEFRRWTVTDSSINVSLTNHSNYMLLYVPTPDNVTGVKILIESENVSAVYEKHTHCLKLNTSRTFKTCDLARYEYHNFTEITPFGSDTYLLQYEPDYTFNVTLYTPFETIDADLTINKTVAEPINTDINPASMWDVLYIMVPVSLIIWLIGMI